MATRNMNMATKWANFYGVQCQLVAGKQPNTCKTIIYKGTEYPASNMTGIELESFFAEIANGCEVTGTSKANQKVSDAHGRDDNEQMRNFLNQFMTYADRFEGIQFVNQPLSAVFAQVIESEQDCKVTSLNNWVLTMKDFYGDKALNTIKKMLSNKTIYIVGGHVFAKRTFEIYIDKYCEVNKMVMSKENKARFIDEYMARADEILNV